MLEIVRRMVSSYPVSNVLMDCIRGLSLATPRVSARRLPLCPVIPKKNVRIRAELSDNCPLLRSATEAASIRYLESQRSDPLLIDPYAGCFVPSNSPLQRETCTHHYILETKFIDAKLLDTVNGVDGLKQVVLLTDGMDTRPYRLNWPTSTMIYDVSTESVFRTSSQKLQGFGAKVPRNCFFFHVPLEYPYIQRRLRSKGFSGNLPSVWAIQNLPLINIAEFEEIVFIVSCLAMKESFFIGALPTQLAETNMGSQIETTKCLEKIFTSNGFRVDISSHSDVARSYGREFEPGDHMNLLFVARQLRFSDDQMETWWREFQRIEDEGDEEGFEEL